MFTAGFPGTYTITWALYVDTDVTTVIYLRKNNARIDESEHLSASANDIWTYDQGRRDDNSFKSIKYYICSGGRTLLLHLEIGDTLDLTHDGDIIAAVTFCVSLTTFDVI